MPTAVLKVDIENIPPVIEGLNNYQNVIVLLRIQKRPVEQLYIPIRRNRLLRSELIQSIKDRCGAKVLERMLFASIGWEPIETARPLPRATVAMATRDRPEDLKRCLDAMMQLPDDGQEYLVVDNCPTTDATARLVASYKGRLRYVREDRPGLNAARNRAMRDATHEIIVFCDDDALPDHGWLRSLLRNFNDPMVLCVTGLVMPLELETLAQEWFEKYTPHGRGFSRRIFHGGNHSALNVSPVGVGANMALRRKTLDIVGPFDEALDAGTPTRTGGDIEMFYRILASGYRIVYDPEALNWHRHRRTWSDLRSTVYGYGAGVYSFWTRALIIDKELEVVRLPWLWFRHKQLPNLIRSILRRPGRVPIDLLLAELAGCLMGPWLYLSHSRHLRQRNKAI